MYLNYFKPGIKTYRKKFLFPIFDGNHYENDCYPFLSFTKQVFSYMFGHHINKPDEGPSLQVCFNSFHLKDYRSTRTKTPCPDCFIFSNAFEIPEE